MPARKPTTASQSDSVITRHSSARTTPWHIVDASRGIDEVELDIRDIVLPIVNELVVSARKGSNGGNDEFNVGDIAGDGTLHVLPLRKMWQDGEIDLSSFAINTATVVSDSGTGSNNRS